MSLEERDALAKDIKKNGQRLKILLLGGKIIDGRNRYLACIQHGIEPKVVDVNSAADPKTVITSLNFLRRHWSTKERAEFAARMNLAKKASNDAFTEAELAEQFNISRRTIQRKKAEIRESTPRRRTTREILREIQPKKLAPQMVKAQKSIEKKFGVLLSQIERQVRAIQFEKEQDRDVTIWLWKDYPYRLEFYATRLHEEAEKLLLLQEGGKDGPGRVAGPADGQKA